MGGGWAQILYSGVPPWAPWTWGHVMQRGHPVHCGVLSSTPLSAVTVESATVTPRTTGPPHQELRRSPTRVTGVPRGPCHREDSVPVTPGTTQGPACSVPHWGLLTTWRWVEYPHLQRRELRLSES